MQIGLTEPSSPQFSPIKKNIIVTNQIRSENVTDGEESLKLQNKFTMKIGDEHSQ